MSVSVVNVNTSVANVANVSSVNGNVSSVASASPERNVNISTQKTLNFNWSDHKKNVDTIKPTVRIENIVVTFHTLKNKGFKCYCNKNNVCNCGNRGSGFDLLYLSKNVPGVEYNPKRFAAAVHRINEPNLKSTALIFQAGKVVVTGTKTECDAKRASLKHTKMLKETFPHMDIFFDDYQIQNVVGNGETTFKIALEQFATDHITECKYDPENFPGVTYRPNNIDITMLIFVSGKMVIPGGKSENAIREAFNTVLPLLRQYKKKDSATATVTASKSTPYPVLPRIVGKAERRRATVHNK